MGRLMKNIRIQVDPTGFSGIGAAILLLRPTGVNWSHQAGGTCCHQKKAEGVFVPLTGQDLSEEPEADVVRDFHHFERPEHVQAIRTMCERLELPFRPSDDPASLADSCEAWVRGRIHTQGRSYDVFPIECHGMEAILLWDNSD
jgi:hypothetical protein